MALLDLRTFLEKTDEIGELKVIRGADKHLEIGAITEISLQNDGPALLFEDIPGFPARYRVATNVCSTRCGSRRTPPALKCPSNSISKTRIQEPRRAPDGSRLPMGTC